MKRTLRIILLILVIAGITLFCMRFKTYKTLTVNDQIRNVFLDFDAFTKNNRTIVSDSLCGGGFINTSNDDLRKIADNIVTKRIINNSPLEYASNQDEAGITCLATIDTWVLFSALNDGEFYCIDSTGQKGPMSFSRETLKCTR
ncbi:MAG: hypothetical protein V4576_00545 [Patescibacteria group bacterium]